ncbi:unnamed protein product [Staurois parvus]|uniref:Secreted protein n=1 Tax=Staurois parvus TaxID=386267 RepID=A0ABN9FDQ9_9NEOB|nr:unnamed protein product [Staurois parvus]
MDWPAIVGLICLMSCSTRAGQRVLPAIRDSTLQPVKHLELIILVYLRDIQTCRLCLGVVFFPGPCILFLLLFLFLSCC